MSQGLVVGIFADSDVAAIESALTSQQIELGKVKVLRSASASTPAEDESELDFIDVAENMEGNSFADDMTHRTGIVDDSEGTSVPMGRNPSPEEFLPRGGASRNYLGGLDVPADEAENFNEAIEAGRAVIAYPDAGADAQKIAAAFKAAGLRNVRSY